MSLGGFVDRRDFLQAGAAALAAQAAAGPAWAQASAGARTGATAPPATPSRKLQIDAYSRHLQWLRTPDEVAQAVIEMGYDGLDVTVRPYPGHVNPEKVATELPTFVNGVRAHGVRVSAITTNISDADSPNAERILDAAASLGIHHYWWGTYRYDLAKPLALQIEALKPRVAKLAALNAKYGMKAMYHTYSFGNTVGSAVWDLLQVLREFDPAHVSFHYDLGHMTNAGGNGVWAVNLRAAGPYVGGVSIKDSVMELNLPVVEGGPFTGAPGSLNFGFGAPPGPPSAGSAPPPAAPAARPPTASRGGGGQPNPWRIRQVPLGTGMVDLPQFAQVLKEIAFSGPLEIQSEYPNGGADNAADKLTLPRAIVLGAMKRDLLTLRAVFGPAGLI
jgi:sugar phosphate isomerase/epimerase